MAVNLDDYVPVNVRIAELRAKHPEASLQPVNPAEPFRIIDVAGKTFLVYAAAAYRTPDDSRPGIGIAWEPVPGKTPYTRDSEIMVAETSAWGRAIIAVLAADATKGIATREEVANRQSGRESAQERHPAASGREAVIRKLPTMQKMAGIPIRPDLADLVKTAQEAETLDSLRDTWTKIGNGGHLTAEIAHPATGEKMTVQEFLYERADALGSPKSANNGDSDAAGTGHAAQKLASKRGAK